MASAPHHPPEETPASWAKRLMRCEPGAAIAYKDLEGRSRVIGLATASDLSGAPLIRADAAMEKALLAAGACAVLMGHGRALELISMAEPAPEAEAAARFEARHPGQDGALMRLVPQSAYLRANGTEEMLSGAALLAESSEMLMAMERRAVDHMNDDHLDAIKLYAERLLGEPEADWQMASLDKEGVDMTGPHFTRLWFDPPLTAPDEIKSRLVELVMKARA